MPLLFLLILTAAPGCKHQDSEWQGTIEVVDGVTDVMNPKKPIYCENVTVESTFLQSIEPSVEQLFKEHEWTISDKINAYSVYLPPDLLHDAGELLNLQDDWDIVYGRSSKNHGFDLLLTFSNRTSEHYGFAYYERNAAFHFGQSEELGEYSWISIVEDWAENLIQHEISHNFGAHDRDRLVSPPSVMSKPSTPEQTIADFTTNLLWLQVNNWLLEDILLMLKNRIMFD